MDLELLTRYSLIEMHMFVYRGLDDRVNRCVNVSLSTSSVCVCLV